MTKINLTLADKNYDVLVGKGLLAEAGALIRAIWQPRKVLILSDSNVAPLYLATVQEQLVASGFQVVTSIVPAGEASKSLSNTANLYQLMLDEAFSRTDGVVALGGGVVGDLAGFVASTFMRGIGFIQIPTSLLAQVDSSVGGKTAVDFGTGKNIVGTFYQPDLVIADPNTLTTLTPRYVAEGYAEVVKMAATSDDPEFWPLIEKIQTPADILTHATALIMSSVSFKAQIVIADEKESGQRRFLNFGHTLGHAIELLAHGDLAHGEAVSIGTVQICKVFEAKGLTAPGISAQIERQLKAVGLPTTSELLFTPKFYEQLLLDKKNHGDHLNFVYISKLGEPKIYPVKKAELKAFLTTN
ncbi:3-dehydroquinate synthase [Agrilactobacillus yilanensis]|uniref:3-dehydroquinate synthase n=1 Tax=Agrilactobacillus yilanensis TaxID=2485997 RepID=A0ABW4JAB1_9LACO|nr:3-dehydroquinate synthase [Agrilactobacillus yilanensis]